MNTRIIAAGITAAVIVAAAGTAFATTGSASTASDYTPISPVRVLDTRNNIGVTKVGPVSAGGTVKVTLAGSNGVPADVTGAVLNVTAVGATGNGYLTVYPDGSQMPATSNVNYGTGGVVANEATVAVTDGAVDIHVSGKGTVSIVVDLAGYYTPSAPAYTPPEAVTQTLAGVASVNTGGSFNARATEVGTVDLPAGSYLVTLSAKATPIVQSNTSVQVFPSIHLYNQPKNASFTGDVLDAGGTALESGTVTNADLYSSNSGVVTVTQDTTMVVYAFGYDSDSGEGTYQLDGVTVTATPVTVASN